MDNVKRYHDYLKNRIERLTILVDSIKDIGAVKEHYKGVLLETKHLKEMFEILFIEEEEVTNV